MTRKWSMKELLAITPNEPPFNDECECAETIQARTDLEDLQSQLDEVLQHRKKAHGHFCQEWDFLYIEDTDPEFEACTCFREES